MGLGANLWGERLHWRQSPDALCGNRYRANVTNRQMEAGDEQLQPVPQACRQLDKCCRRFALEGRPSGNSQFCQRSDRVLVADIRRNDQFKHRHSGEINPMFLGLSH